MKKIIICLFFPLAMSCQSCYKEYYTDSRLQEEKDIVLSVLAPDTSNGFIRENAIEVFVGKIVPTDIHNIYTVYGMQDSLLKELMINTRQFYIAYYKYDPNAIVSIEGNGQNVILEYTDRGIYRDINRSLKIKPSARYKLKVEKKDGRVFASETQILSSTFITNAFLDTTLTPVQRTGSIYFDTILVGAQKDPRAHYYVLYKKNDNFSFPVTTYSFQSEIYDAAIFTKNEFDTTKIDYVKANYEFRAIDSAYGLFHQPHGHSMTAEFGDWDITLYDIPIEKRSNIKGKNVVGVFGNYSADRKKVTYKADW